MTGFFSQVTQATMSLVTNYTQVFLYDGFTLFKSIAAIRLVWEGFLVSFQNKPASHIGPLLVTIAIAYSSLLYYEQPFPGVGKGLTKIVTDAGLDMADRIDTSTEESIGTNMADAMGSNSGTTWSMITNGPATIRYFVIESMLSVMQASITGVIALGFIVTGILILIGPVFIPFLLVPHFEWLALNWFRSLIQYSFYPVIGNAFVFVYGQVWLNYFSTVNFPMTAATMAAQMTVIVTMGLAGAYGMFKVPQIVSGLFSGSSGLGGWR